MKQLNKRLEQDWENLRHLIRKFRFARNKQDKRVYWEEYKTRKNEYEASYQVRFNYMEKSK